MSAAALADRLKAEAERLLHVDCERSLEIAEEICRLEPDGSVRALGLMARADALRVLGRYVEATEAYQAAADVYQAAGDEVGWARTRIGATATARYTGTQGQVLVDLEEARRILEDHGLWLRLARLETSCGLLLAARMEPRLPARFDTVLGVAATTSNPREPARYSNLGDERELGDHVATFGGNASERSEPEDGVIGIYSGEFPDQRPNETGWAFWSGTSFATAIVSGIAANFWTASRKQHPQLHAASVLADLHAEASAFGPYVAALRTPAIEVHGRWR